MTAIYPPDNLYGRNGIFEPPAPVPDDAPLVDRVVAYSRPGRGIQRTRSRLARQVERLAEPAGPLVGESAARDGDVQSESGQHCPIARCVRRLAGASSAVLSFVTENL